MGGFAFSSYKHERDREALTIISNAIFVLKLFMQNRLAEYNLDAISVTKAVEEIVGFTEKLIKVVQTVSSNTHHEGEVDLTLTGAASRFIDYNPYDIDDRIIELKNMLGRLTKNPQLQVKDFQLLDRLQGILEAEVSEGMQSLYGF